MNGKGVKCQHCGNFNETNAKFCSDCGNKIQNARPQSSRKSHRSSRGNRTALISLVVVAGFLLLFGVIYVTGDKSSSASSASSATVLPANVNLAQVDAVAGNFMCACDGCNLPLIECTCDMPKGSVEEKNFIGDNLSKGLTVAQVTVLVDQKYGHRKRG